MMDCTTGPLECMHVNKWVQCAHVPSFPFLHLPVFFFLPFSQSSLRRPTPSFSSSPLLSLQPFLTCAKKCMPGHAYVLIFTYGYTPTHSAELRSTRGTVPLWPQWLITFNKANRVLLVRINLLPVLVRGAVTSNCQTLCSMKWEPLSPLPGPKLTIASIFYACAPAPPSILFFFLSLYISITFLTLLFGCVWI